VVAQKTFSTNFDQQFVLLISLIFKNFGWNDSRKKQENCRQSFSLRESEEVKGRERKRGEERGFECVVDVLVLGYRRQRLKELAIETKKFSLSVREPHTE
jgi:hypothetical protein